MAIITYSNIIFDPQIQIKYNNIYIVAYRLSKYQTWKKKNKKKHWYEYENVYFISMHTSSKSGVKARSRTRR